MIAVHRTFVLVATVLIAAPFVAVFLVVGGATDQPGRLVAGAPLPAAAPTVCRAEPESACPQAFRRPLEC